MFALILVVGSLLLIFLSLNVLWTTMGLGGGSATKRFSHWLYEIYLFFYWRTNSRLLLAWAGITISVSIFLIWVSTLWLGWTLIFSADEFLVLNATTKQPATIIERVYFVGFTISTLGTGDYQAQRGVWQILMALASLNGLFLITLSITYLLPIVQAATHKRQVAIGISSLGLTPQTILLKAWNGSDCKELETYLNSIRSELATIEQRHLTYPVLHYFHSTKRSESVAASIVALDEALTIAEYAVEERCGLSELQLHSTRQIITEYLYTLNNAFIDPADKTPPPPRLDKLEQANFRLVPTPSFHQELDELTPRRRLLYGALLSEGWTWDLMEKEMEESQKTPDRSLRRSSQSELAADD